MSLRNRNSLKLPRLDPKTPAEHRENFNNLTIWGNDIPLNERVWVAVRRTANLSIATGGNGTNITWQAADMGVLYNQLFSSDLYSWWNPTVDATRLVCPAGLGGFYLAEGSALWGNATVTSPSMYLRKNGLNFRTRQSFPAGGATAFSSIEVAWAIELDPGDYVQLAVRHASAGAVDINATLPAATFDSYFPCLQLTRISE